MPHYRPSTRRPVGQFGNPVFTTQFINHVRGVAREAGLTVGDKEGYTSDDPRTFSPPIFATSPNPIQMIKNEAAFLRHAMVPSRPFYEGEKLWGEMPLWVNETIENINGRYIPKPVESNSNMEYVIIMVGLVGLSIILFNR